MIEANPAGRTCPECGHLILAGYDRHVERCRETPGGERAKP